MVRQTERMKADQGADVTKAELSFKPVPHDHEVFLAKASVRTGFSDAYDALAGAYQVADAKLKHQAFRTMHLRPYQSTDEAAIVALWHECGLTRPWNDPHRDIARKLAQQPELFLVATQDDIVVGTAMVGFDGHRGWVYYLAVSPGHRRLAIGRTLMQDAERLLIERGCPKLNLMVRSSNADVIAFYRQLGYTPDDVVSLGKRLIDDITTD